ncbi:MAG: glycosyltransferase [Synechococcales cyanobacterium RU_4_20]|nr:glycosyltransferase [Synechococcales cyanobacterium RU_4_20]
MNLLGLWRQAIAWPVKAFFGLSLVVSGTLFYLSRLNSQGPLDAYRQRPPVSIANTLPDFLALPMGSERIILPLALVLLATMMLRFLPPNNLTRLIFRPILIVLALRYLVWRSLSTLDFSTPLEQTLGLMLFGVECVCILSAVLNSMQTIFATDKLRSRQADRDQQAVISGNYLPSVDVLVPTYNEPDFIVRRTVMGCQAMDYPNKTIYILDDTRRPQIRAMAAELGCQYLTRPNNDHAKAGNLNHALTQIGGELVAIVDADFVPFRNFLIRTVGFFQQSQISLVQTPQYFYNPDYHARNLGLSDFLPNDLELFFGSVQSCRDVFNSVICCGSSYVVRRSSLDQIGGYFIKCCVEDYQTSLKMLTHGQRIIYLNEILSMGESTRTYNDFIDQRLRWLQGNWQVYFCGKDLPLAQRLNWGQKSFLVTQFIACIQPFLRLILLITPLLCIYGNLALLDATLAEILYYFAPFWFFSIAVQGWSTDYRISQFWYDVYETTFCFPAVSRLVRLLGNPFRKVSRVTRKGVKLDGKHYNFEHSLPLILMLALSLGCVMVQLVGQWLWLWPAPWDNQFPIYFWLGYNCLLMGASILSAIDQPIRRSLDRFPLKRPCRLLIREQPGPDQMLVEREYEGVLQDLSEGGASAVFGFPLELQPGAEAELWLNPESSYPESSYPESSYPENSYPENLHAENLQLPGQVLRVFGQGRQTWVSVQFSEALPSQSHRQIVQLLYGEMTEWKRRKKPGGFDALLAILLTVVRLRPLLKRYRASA